MPTSWRSACRSTSGRSTRCPQTTISPPSTFSKRSMQRSAVLLPEPERPISASTSPRSTAKETPSSTLSGPKLFWTSRSDTIGSEEGVFCCMSGWREVGPATPHPLFQFLAEQGEGIAHREIGDGDDGVDDERLEQRVVDDLARAHQFDEADDGGERGVLDDLHHEAD